MTYRHTTAKPQPQLIAVERVTPGVVFDQVGIDCAGTVYLKLEHVCKPNDQVLQICILQMCICRLLRESRPPGISL